MLLCVCFVFVMLFVLLICYYLMLVVDFDALSVVCSFALVLMLFLSFVPQGNSTLPVKKLPHNPGRHPRGYF